jgi:diketogulonate reductase-like aldo/keto reductase
MSSTKGSVGKLDIQSTLPLKGSSYQIPQIGFGVYLSPAEKCIASCKKALEAGYRHIDTAQYYENEVQVGKAVSESGLPRKEVYITTKILFPGNDSKSTYESVVKSVNEIAGKEGYVDLFLIHSPNGGPEARKLMWQALEKAKQDGKVRDIGVSNYGIQHIEEIKTFSKELPVVNQIEVRLAFRYSSGAVPLTPDSSIHGATSANASNTARPTTSSSKPTAHLSATKRLRNRLSSASLISTK